MPQTRAWIRALTAVLQQGIDLAEELDVQVFSAPADAAHGSVGAHLRHAAEFVQAFVAGLDTGLVDYDGRARAADVERDPRRAVELLRRLGQELRRLERTPGDRPLCVRLEASVVPGDQRSSVARELSFLVSHTIHHYALVAVQLRARGIEPGPGFGVAPSTLRHRSEESLACAPPSG